jgi:large subunit ribosomal protein L10
MDRKKKEGTRVAIAGKLQKSSATIIAQYRGMTMEELSTLRRDLRQVNCEFRIVQNRLAKKAIEVEVPDAGPLKEKLRGPVGIVYLFGDPAAGAKKVVEFEKNNEKFVVTGGLFENKLISVGDIKALAELPSREVLLGRIVGTLVSPHRGLVTVLNGINRNLVQVINAIKEKKSQ